MTFSLGWVDHDREARDRVHTVLNGLGERESRDELGLGQIRDSLADLLFPGTSTVQTRLRYFLIVPWVYRALEQGGVSPGETRGRARDLELSVAEHLRATDEQGVIGRVAGRRIKRLPSSIYWLGLGAWGLRQDRRGHGSSRWHRGLPARPHGFPKLDTLALSQTEAEYLQDRVAQSAPDSLLAHLFLRDHVRPATCRFVWEHPDYAGFPPARKAELNHARRFSGVIYGVPLLYNLLLARRAGREQRIEQYERELTEWSKELDRSAMADWSLPDFWITVAQRRRITHATYAFVNGWIDLVRSGAMDVGERGVPADDSGPARLVRKREKALKRERSRFSNRRMLDQWGGRAGVHRMDYRWAGVSVYLSDLAAGLGRA